MESRAHASKVSKIKQARQKGAHNEVLIRRFNLKRFDEVIKDLRAQSDHVIRPSLSKEEFDARLMGEFLFDSEGCDKEIKGYYFGQEKQKNQLALKAFLRKFSFKGLPVLTCWRRIFSKTGLPKEGQQIMRIIEHFQDVYLEQNTDNADIANWDKDVVWTLSVKLLDLNTNLTNLLIKPSMKYTRETFVNTSVKMLKHAVSPQHLEEMYDELLERPFECKMNLNEQQFRRINELVYSIAMHDFKSEALPMQASLR